MPHGHRTAIPQVTALDEQFGTHRVVMVVMVGVAAPGPADAAQPGQARRVGMLTGANSLNATQARYQVKGTDLGILWADQWDQILVAFGDTFGPGWVGPSSEV